jgi:hypothetical protein
MIWDIKRSEIPKSLLLQYSLIVLASGGNNNNPFACDSSKETYVLVFNKRLRTVLPIQHYHLCYS